MFNRESDARLLVNICVDARASSDSLKSLKNMGVVDVLGDLATGGASSLVTGAAKGLAGSLFGRSGFQQKKDQMQLNEQMMNINAGLMDYGANIQQKMTEEERAYQEDLFRRQWDEYNSPAAMVRALEAAGLDANQIFGSGSSPIGSAGAAAASVSPVFGHSSTGGSASRLAPQFAGDPLAAAQIADLDASANLKNAQAENEPIRGELLQQQADFQALENAGMPYVNEMKAMNAEILRLTKDNQIDLSNIEVQTALQNLDLLARKVQELDDKHDLHGLMKQQAVNQCAIQVASFVAKVWESALTRSKISVNSATVEVLKQQANKLAIDALQGRISALKDLPNLRRALSRSPELMKFYGLGGPLGTTLGGLAALAEMFLDRPDKVNFDEVLGSESLALLSGRSSRRTPIVDLSKMSKQLDGMPKFRSESDAKIHYYGNR